MRLLSTMALAGALTGAAFAYPAMARQAAPSDAEAALYSEMWAMAGICNQLVGYDVRQAELATFLNARVGSLAEDAQQRILNEKEDRLDAMRAEVERLETLPRGNRRQRGVDENAAELRTRCTRLSQNDTAAAFFIRRS